MSIHRKPHNRRPRPFNRLAAAATAAAATAGIGLVASRHAVADTYTWTTPNDGNWSTGFTQASSGSTAVTPVSDFANQLVFTPGSYNAYDDLGAGADGFFDLNTITVNNTPDTNSINLGVNSAAGGTGPATLLFGGTGSGLFINGGSVTLGVVFNTSDGTQIVNAGGGTFTTATSIGFASNGTTTITNGVAGTTATGKIVLNDATTAGITGITMNGSNSTINLANYNPTPGSFLIPDLATGVTGTVNITAGYVQAADTGGDLFGNSLILNVAAGATFDFNNNAETMGGVTGSGNIVLGTAGLTLVAPGNRSFNGAISGTGGVTQNVSSGVLTLGGNNSYSGTTTIIAGATIRATVANAFSPNSLVSVASGGTFDPGGFSQTIAGLSGGNATTNVPVAAGTVLTINPASGTTDLFLGNVAGAGNLTINGPGTEVLNGLTGGVTGTVSVASGTLTENFAPLSLASAVNIATGATLDTLVTSNATLGFPFTDTGTLVKDGPATLTLAAANPTLSLSALTLNNGSLNLTASSNGASQIGTPALTGGSGTLAYTGTASTAATQSFSGTTLTGSLEFNASAGTGGTATVAIGSLTRLAGSTGTVDFNPLNAGASFTTTAATSATTGTIGAYATYAGTSWAVAGAGGTATAVTPLPAASYTANSFGTTTHTDVTSTSATAAAGASTYDVRFNTAVAGKLTLAGTTASPNVITDGGILVTPNVGANTSNISGGVLTAPANTDLVVQQFDTAGSLLIASVIGNVAGTPVVQSGSTLAKSSATATVTSTTGLYVGESVSDSAGNLSAGTRIVSINSPTSITLSTAATAATTTDTLTFTPNTNLVKAGPGLLTLSGTNTLNGVVQLNGGTLATTVFTSLGLNASTGSSAVVFNGGTLQALATETGGSTIQPWIFAPGGGTVSVNAGFTVSKQGNTLFGSGPLTVSSAGAGTGIFAVGSNVSTLNGPVTVASGILRFTSSDFVSVNGVTVNAGGQYQINDNSLTASYGFASGSVLSLSGTGPAGYLFPGAMAVTVQSGYATNNPTFTNPVVLPASATIGVYSTNTSSATPLAFPNFLNLTGVVSGPGTLTTAGIAAANGAGGVLTLTGSNTYTGGTNVISGTLRVNNTAGSGTGTGAVNVYTGATLGGTGTISGPVTVQGTITAGAVLASANSSVGIGTLTTGAQQWNASGGLLAKVSTTGTTNDKLVMSGLTVSATNVSGSQFLVNVTGLGALTVPATGTGSVLVLAEDTEAAATNPFGPALSAATLSALTLSSTTNLTSATGSFTLATQLDTGSTGGYDLVLEDTAAPEPTSLLLAALAAAPLALGRRRRTGRASGPVQVAGR